MTLSRSLHVALFACLVATPATPAGAQSDTIRVGTTAWAQPVAASVDTLAMYMIRDGARQHVMTYIESVRRTPDEVLVVQHNVMPTGSVMTLDTIALDALTLATRWHADVSPRGRMRVTLADGRMRGTSTTPAGVSAPVDTVVPGSVFDFSVASILARYLPLRAGYAATMDTWDIHGGRVPVDIRVTDDGEIDVSGQKARAWKVETTTRGRTVASWVDQVTRRTIRVAASMGNAEMVAERP